MEKSEIIWVASVAVGKNIGYEELKYSDYLYRNEDKIDEVWTIVDECIENGTDWFKEKYKDYELY
jgi:hypothetical protein